MRFRNFWLDCDALCEECGLEYRWLTACDRPRDWQKRWEDMETAEFLLPCGHVQEFLLDVIPLRGHPA